MLNPGLPDVLWTALDGRLWHATETNGLRGIVSTGEIRPGIGNRFLGSFCRKHGCICLFDCGPTSTNVKGRTEQMLGWFGTQQKARVTVWLEIDRPEVNANLWDAAAARVKSNLPSHENQAQPYGEFIHGVEACHEGPIPVQAIVRALAIDASDKAAFQSFPFDGDILDRLTAFQQGLPALVVDDDADDIVARLLAARPRYTGKLE